MGRHKRHAQPAPPAAPLESAELSALRADVGPQTASEVGSETPTAPDAVEVTGAVEFDAAAVAAVIARHLPEAPAPQAAVAPAIEIPARQDPPAPPRISAVLEQLTTRALQDGRYGDHAVLHSLAVHAGALRVEADAAVSWRLSPDDALGLSEILRQL